MEIEHIPAYSYLGYNNKQATDSNRVNNRMRVNIHRVVYLLVMIMRVNKE